MKTCVPYKTVCPTLLCGLLILSWTGLAPAATSTNDYFAIEVIDDQTGRPVPMVQLRTTSSLEYYTDSAGVVAFNEPGMMDRRVFFDVSAQGYEFRKDGFGIRGVALQTKPGDSAQLKIKRINIAERLYRITGAGIYRDTVLLGRKPPIAEPLLNAEVTGQDGGLGVVYRGQLYWFYGDTLRASYALGNFAMTGATSGAIDKINPAVGFDLHYFKREDGFTRPMAPREGKGVVWAFSSVVLNDDTGRERMLTFAQRRLGLGAVLENGFLVYNDETEVFEWVKTVELDWPLAPTGFYCRVKRDGVEYLYFGQPYPFLRVKADWDSYQDTSAYEGYTCLKPGARYTTVDEVELDRATDDTLVWTWKKDTPPLSESQQVELITAGKLKREESPMRLVDTKTGKPLYVNNTSCNWNAYRNRYVLIISQFMGASPVGEVWYSEADQPEGPWTTAKKIITHANNKKDVHDFYNPHQDPFFDSEDGRVIYLEGSYADMFSGNAHVTPLYSYNQIMYRLDLSDPRLALDAPKEIKDRDADEDEE